MTDVLGPAAAGAVNTLTTTADVSDPTAGDTWFQDCVANNPATGTNLPSRFSNRILQQMRRIIRLTGVPLSNADDDMLGQAIQSGALNWAGTFGGAADALTATLSPAPTLLIDGMRISGLCSGVNATTTPTLNVNGLGAFTIIKDDGLAVAPGDVSGSIMFIYDGAVFRVIGPSPSDYAAPTRNVTTYSTAGTFTFTPTTTGWYYIELCGGGGGGAGAGGGVSYASGGAGSGGYSAGWFYLVAGAGVTMIVGAGGAGSGPGSSGSAGGTTSFGSYLQATAGGGGGSGSITPAGGVAGLGSGGQINTYGSYGGDGNPDSGHTGGQGGASHFGGGGRTATAGTGPANGLAAGSGGGGIWGSAGTGQFGGNGAAGIIIISN